MTIFERIEHWFNCRKIELSHWLKDSNFSYHTSWDAENETYKTIKLSPVVTAGTPEWEEEQAYIKKCYLENKAREEKLCALDPGYKAQYEKKEAKRKAEREAELEKLDPEIRRIIEMKNAKSLAELSK